jgi:hypothetical protein
MARKKVFPEWFRIALQQVASEGEALAEFKTASECAGQRLSFYKFLAEVRNDPEDGLCEVAKQCGIHIVQAPLTKVKRFLRFDTSNATANPLAIANAEETKEAIAQEEMMRQLREQFKK